MFIGVPQQSNSLNIRKPSLEIKTSTIKEEPPQITAKPILHKGIPENPTFPFMKKEGRGLVKRKNKKIAAEEFDLKGDFLMSLILPKTLEKYKNKSRINMKNYSNSRSKRALNFSKSRISGDHGITSNFSLGANNNSFRVANLPEIKLQSLSDMRQDFRRKVLISKKDHGSLKLSSSVNVSPRIFPGVNESCEKLRQQL
ncbi:unnamed protein product [Moneuplotes crassus]|uniref:Uncharacterized protein n=1 Tax=Euplotes crassus TaxID=5936 RepID=A0AAD1XAE7_EUPCR|nr:unnamed protein product [Moneuplotes crassus]